MSKSLKAVWDAMSDGPRTVVKLADLTGLAHQLTSHCCTRLWQGGYADRTKTREGYRYVQAQPYDGKTDWKTMQVRGLSNGRHPGLNQNASRRGASSRRTLRRIMEG